MFRTFLFVIFVGIVSAETKSLMRNLIKKKYVNKAAFAEHDGTLLDRSHDYPLRQAESTAFAKGLDDWENLGGRKMGHEGIQFTVSEAGEDYLVASRGANQRVLTVRKTGVYLIYIFCGKLIKEKECITKSREYAKYVTDMGY